MDKRILDYIDKKIKYGSSASIVIAGCSCSGKTTLAKEITESFGGDKVVTTLHEDDFYKDLKDIPRSKEGVLADHINAFCCKEYINSAKELISMGKVRVPIYDLSVNARTIDLVVAMKGMINVFEGLHAITLLRNEIECLTVFINPGDQECLERRIKRDIKQWNIEREDVVSYWNRCIKPVTEECIMTQAAYADIVVKG